MTLSIDEMYRKIAVKIEYNCNQGSGFVCQLKNCDFSYIITAKHCFGEKIKTSSEVVLSDILITQPENQYAFEIIELFFSDDKDIAILQIKNLGIEPSFGVNVDNYNGPINVFGFPSSLQDQAEKRQKINCVVSQNFQKKIELESSTPLFTWNTSTPQNTEGLSGSGIFIEKYEQLFMIGVFTELKANDGQYNVATNYKINELNQFLTSKNLPKITTVDEKVIINEMFDIEILKNKFHENLDGWLKTYYIPDLHTKGIIEENCEKFLYSFNFRQDNLKKTSEIQVQLRNIYPNNTTTNCAPEKISSSLNLISDFTKEVSQDPEYFKKIPIHGISMKHRNNRIDEIENNINYFSHYLANKTIKALETLSEKIKKGEYTDSHELDELKKTTNIFKRCFQIIRAREERDWVFDFNIMKNTKRIIDLSQTTFNIIRETSDLPNKNFLLFTGNPGTGKTHASASITENRLNNDLPSLILRAKNYNDFSLKWEDILQKEGIHIKSIESLCLFNDAERKNSNLIEDISPEKTIFLVCVDGIDESHNWDLWKEKINTADAFCKLHPFIKIIFLSRPYSVEKIYENRVNLYNQNDADVLKLFDKYIYHYKIDVSKSPWIKWSINDARTLRLFCEIFENNKIPENYYPSISKLLKKKIKSMEIELNKIEIQTATADFVVLNFLINLSDLFLKSNKINHDQLKTIVPSSINQDKQSLFIEFIEKQGFLRLKIKKSTGIKPDEYIYEMNNDYFTEYALAVKIYNDYNSSGEFSFPEHLIWERNIINMFALILFEENNILAWSKKDKKEERYEEVFSLETQLFVLSNANLDKVTEFKEPTIKLMKESSSECRKILRKLILPISRIKNHPLGASLLHEFLKSFKSVAERDLIWSPPDYFPYKGSNGFEAFIENPLIEFSLNKEELFNGLPLIFAWSLTSVDNKIRNHCKLELTKWGTLNPKEYLELLRIVFKTNDPQMKEDLSIVAMGICTKLFKEDNILKDYADFFLKNVFAEEKIRVILNAVVRHASRIVIERAFLMEHCTEFDVGKARPPYLSDHSLLLPFEELEKYDSWSGSKPITSDLNWYVIKKAYEGFFNPYRGTKNDYEDEDIVSWEDLDSDMLEKTLLGELGEISSDDKKEIISVLENKKKKKPITTHFIKSELKKGLTPEEIISQFSIINDNQSDDTINGDLVENHNDISNEKKDGLNKESAGSISSTTLNPGKAYDYSDDAHNLLSRYFNDENEITPHKFAVAAGIGIVKSFGWNEKEFANSNTKDKKLPADHAILHTYSGATHGSKSEVMSFAEKYVWMAIHEIQGYLADRLEHTDFYQNIEMLSDYSKILSISNPMQNLANKDNFSNHFHIPDNSFFFNLESKKTDKNEIIKEWIDEAPVPNWNKYIHMGKDYIEKINEELKSDFICLHNYSVFTHETIGVKSLVWIYGIIVETKNMETFKRDIYLKNSDLLGTFANEHGFDSEVKCACYFDPSDISWMNWIEEETPFKEIFSVIDGKPSSYKVYVSTLKTTSRTFDDEEKEYLVPSKITRKQLDIIEGNGNIYKDSQGIIKTISIKNDGGWHNNQKLLYAKKETLLKSLKSKGLNICWLARLQRAPVHNKSENDNPLRYYKNFYTIILNDGTTLPLCQVWNLNGERGSSIN